MNDKGILIRQPTILGPDGHVLKQMDHPIVEERKQAPPTKEQIAQARTEASKLGFRIIKQSANTRRGNIRRARQAELKRTLKGTGKSIAEYRGEVAAAERRAFNERRAAEQQERREARERRDTGSTDSA